MYLPSKLITLTAVLHFVSALSIQQRQNVQPRVVSLPLQRREIRDPVAHDMNRMKKRSGAVQGTLDNLQTLYFLNASLGTPPQNVRLHIDTGSSDLWVNTPSSRLCSSRQQPCSDSFTYTANSSSTYQYVGSYFNISYADGSGASGDYATDTMRFSGTNITSLQFGIGYQTTTQQNILGIGYPSNEVQVVRAGFNAYQNLPTKMAAEGITASSSYSLWLNDLNSNTGNVLFGGVDRDRFDGNLVTVPIQQFNNGFNNGFNSFFITLTGLDVGSKNIASDLSLAVLMDSGTSLTYLPNSIANSIYDLVGATYQQSDGAAFVPCSVQDQNLTMTFKFSSPASITVPLNEMILSLGDSFDNNVPACLFGIVPAGNSNSVLGDTFLRSAYVVYDTDNNEISLANAKFNVTTSQIVEINSNSSVPFATKASNPVAATDGVPNVTTQKQGSSAGALVPSLAMVLLCVAAGIVV